MIELVRAELRTDGKSKDPSDDPSNDACAATFQRLIDRSGLMTREGARWKFRHHQFQEFLVARGIMRRGSEGVGMLVKRLDQPYWHEAVRLAVAYRAIDAPGLAAELAGSLVQAALTEFTKPADKVLACATVGKALVDLLKYDVRELGTLVQPLLQPIVELIENEDQPGIEKWRIEAAEVLGVFGDPRISWDEDRFFVDVPEGHLCSAATGTRTRFGRRCTSMRTASVGTR